jgi:hypothetical protein
VQLCGLAVMPKTQVTEVVLYGAAIFAVYISGFYV